MLFSHRELDPRASDISLLAAVGGAVCVCSIAFFVFGLQRDVLVDQNYFRADAGWPTVYFVVLQFTIRWALAALLVAIPGYFILRRLRIVSGATLSALGALTGAAVVLYLSEAYRSHLMPVAILTGALAGFGIFRFAAVDSYRRSGT